MKHSPKLAILQSLDAMDQLQMETVLRYIKGVLQQHDSVEQKSFKKEAMKEIRKALRQDKNSGTLQFA
jgi:tRNA G37 N-methylase TrmD